MWWFNSRGPSGFSASATAEEVTHGIDASDITAIVTGASSGIGTETARVLAFRGAHVIMGVRNLLSGEKIEEAIKRESPTAKIDSMELDLSSMDSVRKFASKFNSSGLPLNILINNAGIMATPFMHSKDNIELQFATNHLGKAPSVTRIHRTTEGHFLLTNLLLETMKKTAQESMKEGRIVNVSSRRHKLSYHQGIRFDRINDQSGYSSMSAYGQSKLANILHMNELARLFKDNNVNITANSVHPGVVATNLFRHNSLLRGLVGILGKYIKQGAATTCYVALHPQVLGITGCYFADNNLAEASSQANDSKVASKLWDYSLNLVNTKAPTSTNSI